MSPLLLLALQAPALDLRQAPVVPATTRIQLTPRLDGKIDDEEWDAFTEAEGVKTYLQWEPGALHVAASGAMGKDILVSIDTNGDGWLVGKDNLEARIGQRDGKPFVRLVLLDATNVAGPTYREIPNLGVASTVVVGADGTLEATLGDPGLGLIAPKAGRLAVRVDLVPADAPAIPANEPRALATLSLGDWRAVALPSGLKAKVDFNDIATVPGENVALRFGFTGGPAPKRIAMRTEGLGREATGSSEQPFPEMGGKGASVEYKTGVQKDAMIGYRLARATVTGADGVPGVVQASYRIAPLADIRLNDPTLKPSDKDRALRVGFTVLGNSRERMAGRTTISVPGSFRILNGGDTQKIALFEPRRGLPKSFGLLVPANARGVVPITFAMELEGKKFEVVRYVTID